MSRNLIYVLTMFAFSFCSLNSSQADWPGAQSEWNGYAKHDFECDGRKAYVVVPKTSATGQPWVWRARFPGFHAEADIILLSRGFHIAYINTDGMLGSPKAMQHWDAFYTMMVDKGLAKKVALEGVSRGGLFVYGFAARWPERVACIYADTPVCDFKSWPLGQGIGKGSPPTWQQLLKEYNFTQQQALDYKGNPIDRLNAIAEAKIPVLHIVSLNDQVVPPSENTLILAERYQELGGEIEVMEVKEGTAKSSGHHFTHPNPEKVADFIEKFAGP